MSIHPVYIYIFICVLTYVLMYLWMRKLKDRSKYLKNLPGPKQIFPFGNLLDFISGPTVFLPKASTYIEKYGDTILLHNGAFSWGVLSVDYEFNKLVLSSSVHVERARQYHFFDGWLGQSLLTSSGSKWKKDRKAIIGIFNFSILQEFVSVFDNVGDNLIRKLRKEAGKDSVEISKPVSLYALDVICQTTLGVKIDALEQDDTKYIRSIKIMCNIIVERLSSFFNPVVYQITWNYYKEKMAIKVIHEYVDNVITERIEEHKQKERRGSNKLTDEYEVKKRSNFLDLLLEIRIDGIPLSKNDIRDQVNGIMFGGHDTASSTITFCLLMLATHPEAQDKVFQEQMSIFGTEVKTARATYKELNEMRYLNLVIKETLRLYPPAPFFGRKLTEELEFKGTLYPKDLDIMLLPYMLQRNPTYFPDPEKFIPERFKYSTGRLPFAYIPFSAGPRSCIGQKFAMLEMLSVISKIVRHFWLVPAKPEHKILLAAETVLVSKNGVKISIKNRE